MQGLGCDLFKEEHVTIRVIKDRNRILVGLEGKCHSSKIEFLGLEWVVCDHFEDYLFYASAFYMYTDYKLT